MFILPRILHLVGATEKPVRGARVLISTAPSAVHVLQKLI